MVRAVVDLLLPLSCAACGAPTRDGLCADCGAELPELALDDGAAVDLAPGVRAVGAYAYAGPVAASIKHVKTPGRHGAAPALGRLLRYELALPPSRRAPWAVTWVPSTRRRRAARGAEIPRLLAGPGARRLLRRIRDAPDQTTQDRAGRLSGPVGAFRAIGPVPPRVLLVDDVRTTGATATAAAGALRAAGARRVLVATLAVAESPGARDAPGAADRTEPAPTDRPRNRLGTG
ncbi:ComF family protein [Egibacter rhizosphaerae]|uniref:ComF family protein n=1 Tax=Egibacter rhizosphaerae TaxID=1670831 RepID=A0A411YD93_9ACTN|nr:ComF family protein [Egibacter rhizosphaerae]QBI19199.1 ComF family protein [Egibacter rhizosphaerae]